jgi:hypothetical protein
MTMKQEMDESIDFQDGFREMEEDEKKGTLSVLYTEMLPVPKIP